MAAGTTIMVHVPSKLRDCCGGVAELSVPAESIRDALDELRRMHPALHRSVCDETGAVRRHIGLFVNSTLVPHDALHTALVPGDVFSILPAVSGG